MPHPPGSASGSPRIWRSGDTLLAVGALGLAATLVGHQLVPDIASVGTLLDSVAPWLGLGIAPLALVALVLRARTGAAVLLVPIVVWMVLFGPDLLPIGAADERSATD